VQPQMVEQFLLPSSSQSSLEKLLVFVLGNKNKPQWKMDQKTLAQRQINIPNEDKYFFTPTKQSYSKQVESMEMRKKMGEKEKVWASKVGLVTLLAIEWKEVDHDALVEFLNTFVIKGFDIYLVGEI